MNFDHAFLITYGRSGSTLLQGILNSIPGALIRGENGNILFHIAQIAQSLKASAKFIDTSADPTSPWFGADQIERDQMLDDLIESFVRRVLRPVPDTRLLGFKEIRNTQPVPQLLKYLDFLHDRFPRGCLIFNTRNLDDVMRSNTAAGHAADAARVAAADQCFRTYAAAHPGHSHHVHYDDYVGNPAALTPLFDFLGVPFDRPAVEAVMARTHSVRTRTEGGAPTDRQMASDGARHEQ